MRVFSVLILLVIILSSCNDKDTGSEAKKEDNPKDSSTTNELLPYHQKIYKVEVDFPYKPKYSHVEGGDTSVTKSTFIIDTDTIKIGLSESHIPGAGIGVNDSLVRKHHIKLKSDMTTNYKVSTWTADEYAAIDSVSAYSTLSGYTKYNQFVSMSYYRYKTYIAQLMTWSDSSNAKLVQTSAESFKIIE